MNTKSKKEAHAQRIKNKKREIQRK